MNKVGATAFSFPVGKSSFHRPIAIAPTAVGTFQAEYFYVDPNVSGFNTTLKDVTLDHVTKGEYWVLSLLAGVPNATVTLSWDTNSGIVDDLPNLKVARWNGATWKDEGNGGTTGAASPLTGTVTTAAAITSANFGPFTLASGNANNPLPIGLKSFTARFSSGAVLLDWLTESELNNDFFTVQKTKEGEIFQNVINVKGFGTTALSHSYSAIDYTPQSGTSYYRLKQTDFDGKVSFSKLVAVEVPETAARGIYPNPSSGSEFNVSFSTADLGKIASIKVQDMGGKELFQLSTGNLSSTHLTVQTPVQLNPGLYIISIVVEQQVVRQKLIVQ
jgi:hypothetical protein